MTPDIEHRLRAGIQDYLKSDSRVPVTLRALFGPNWDLMPGQTRTTIGAWFLKKVRKGGFPGLREAGRADGPHMTYARH